MIIPEFPRRPLVPPNNDDLVRVDPRYHYDAEFREAQAERYLELQNTSLLSAEERILIPHFCTYEIEQIRGLTPFERCIYKTIGTFLNRISHPACMWKIFWASNLGTACIFYAAYVQSDRIVLAVVVFMMAFIKKEAYAKHSQPLNKGERMTASQVNFQNKAPQVFPLTQEQDHLYHLYTAERGIINWMRHFRFISSDSAARQECVRESLSGIGMGTIIGGTLGYLSTFLFKKKDDQNRDDKMTLKMVGLGAGIGAGIGGCAKAYQAVQKISHSPEYHNWRNQAIQTNVYPLFQKFLKESDELQDLMCPLTDDLITDPVKAPNGRIYEKKAILDWLEKKNREYPPERLAQLSYDERQEAFKNFCPFRSGYFTQNQLVPDFEYHRRVAVALKKQFDQVLSEQFKQGLLSYHTAMFKDRQALLREITRDVADLFSSGKISQEEFFKACLEFRKVYGLVEEA